MEIMEQKMQELIEGSLIKEEYNLQNAYRLGFESSKTQIDKLTTALNKIGNMTESQSINEAKMIAREVLHDGRF